MEKLLHALKQLREGADTFEELGYGYQSEAVRQAIYEVTNAVTRQVAAAAGSDDD
jgi:hypothetical protein